MLNQKTYILLEKIRFLAREDRRKTNVLQIAGKSFARIVDICMKMCFNLHHGNNLKVL